jgi:hypothetical protein
MNWRKHLSTFVVAAAASTLGGIIAVIYQQSNSPVPGIAVTGVVVPYAPPASTGQSPVRFGATATWWHVVVENEGRQMATALRMRFPQSSVIQVGADIHQPAAEAERIVQADLPDLRPGDSVVVQGWLPTPGSVELAEFGLSHATGLGKFTIHTIRGDNRNDFTDPLDAWFRLMGPALLAALAAGYIILEISAARRKKAKRAKAEPPVA